MRGWLADGLGFVVGGLLQLDASALLDVELDALVFAVPGQGHSAVYDQRQRRDFFDGLKVRAGPAVLLVAVRRGDPQQGAKVKLLEGLVSLVGRAD